MRKDINYHTPQLKRKRQEEYSLQSFADTFKEQIDTIRLMLKDINKKVDVVQQKEEVLEKKIDVLDKNMSGVIGKVNKNPTPCKPPASLPVIEFEGQNLLADPLPPTPVDLMKHCINQLFTPSEIMHGKHNEINERTDKIKAAIGAAFFNDNPHKIQGFWNSVGKITRGNQQRGRVFRRRNRTQAVVLTQVNRNDGQTEEENDEQSDGQMSGQADSQLQS